MFTNKWVCHAGGRVNLVNSNFRLESVKLFVDTNIRNAQKMSSEVASHYRECVYPVPRVSLRIDDTQPVDGGIRQLLENIRPDWQTERVQFKVWLLNLITFLLVFGCTFTLQIASLRMQHVTDTYRYITRDTTDLFHVLICCMKQFDAYMCSVAV